jgi:CHAT domain-containing protein
MIQYDSPNDARLIDDLLTCSQDQRQAWVATHREQLDLSTIAALKVRADDLLLADPIAADDATRSALLVAEQLPGELLGLPLACWARGNWASYHDPAEAVQLYQQALVGYRAVGDTLSLARLLGNLVFAYGDSGLFDEARAAYREARAILLPLLDEGANYLQSLEQNYGVLLENQGHYPEALEAYERALELAYQLDQPIVIAEIQVNRAVVLELTGRLAEAEAILLQQRTISATNNQRVTVARIDLNLGELYAAQGRFAEARERLQTAREQFSALGNEMEVGTVLLYEANLFERVNALRDARQSYTQAQALFHKLEMWPQLGIALVRGAATNRLDGDLSRAARLLDEAQRIWQSLGQPLWRTAVLFERASLALAQCDPANAIALLQAPLPANDNPALMAQRDLLLGEALALAWKNGGDASQREEAGQFYERALSYARRQGNRWVKRQAAVGLGRLALPDNAEVARRHLEAAVALDDLTREALNAVELKASFHVETSELLVSLVLLAVEEQRPAQALGYAWRAKGSVLVDLIQSASIDRVLAPEARAEYDQVRQQLASLRLRAAQGTIEWASEGELDDGSIRALEDRLHTLRQRHTAMRNPFDLLNDTITLLQRMDADVLIEYVRCDDELLAIRADRDGSCRAAWLGKAQTLLELRQQLHHHVFDVQGDPEQLVDEVELERCRVLLRRCHERLLAPLGTLPLDSRLLIAPCDPIETLPFAALWDGQHYLIERHGIQITPTGALLAMPSVAVKPFSVVIVSGSECDDCAEISREMHAVENAMPSAVSTASVPDLIAHLRDLASPPYVLHIAACLQPSVGGPNRRGIQLGEETLASEQYQELPLAGTELVCLSRIAHFEGGMAPPSLAFETSFFSAGVRHMLAPLWPGHTSTTITCVEQFYRALVSGASPSAALQHIQRTFLSEVASRHPAIWAMFMCLRRF